MLWLLLNGALFHRYTLGKIAGLIDIQPLFYRHKIGQVLHDNGADKRGKEGIRFRQYDMVVAQGGIDNGVRGCHKDDAGAAGADLLDVTYDFCKYVRLRGKSDDRDIIGNERNSSVLQFAGGVCLRMNIADFL